MASDLTKYRCTVVIGYRGRGCVTVTFTTTDKKPDRHPQDDGVRAAWRMGDEVIAAFREECLIGWAVDPTTREWAGGRAEALAV